MFLEIEATRALTSLEFLLAVLVGVAPIGVTLWVKLVLYRRRMAEEKEEASRLQNEREADHAKERLRRRHEAWSARFRRTSSPADADHSAYVSRQPTGPRVTASANSENGQTELAQR